MLGPKAYNADSSEAILEDGGVIAATEEERFTRIKHWAGFPSRAIEFCLKEAEVTLEDIDHITIGRDPKAKFDRKVMFLLNDPFGGVKTIRERLRNRKKISSLEDRKSTRLNSSHQIISYAVFCL